MAQDPTLLDDVHARIDGGTNAERAVYEAFAPFRDMLVGMGGYMGERAADLDDVAQRIIAQLRGVHAPGVPESDTPFVLVARDLAPADTALLDLDKVLALVTRDGGPTSHTAILARAKGITAIVGVTGADDLADGQTRRRRRRRRHGRHRPRPPQLVADVEQRIADRLAAAAAPLTAGALADGHVVPLLANLGSPADAAGAVALGAEGVGLFRTEFLFLDSPKAPTVDEQTESYRRSSRRSPARRSSCARSTPAPTSPCRSSPTRTRRTRRSGAAACVRCANHPEVLRDQLTALAQADAATEADLWVMAPMVADAEETEYFVTLARELGIRTAGVMAEVPSLALMADQVLAERRLRVDRHERPDPVHDGRRPHARHRRVLPGPVAPRRPAPRRAARRRRRRRRQGRRDLRRGRSRPAARRRARRPRRDHPLDDARGPRRRARRARSATPSSRPARWPTAALAAARRRPRSRARPRCTPPEPPPPAPPLPAPRSSSTTQKVTAHDNDVRAAPDAPAKSRGGARVAVQKFGTFLSGMVMPNIAIFIAWGIITAFFIPTGWTPVGGLGGSARRAACNVGLVGPILTYLIPLAIAIQGGRMVYETRGAVVGSIVAMGVIVGANGTTMILGAMICGPLGACLIKQIDRSVGRQDQARLRDAGQQLLGRHPRLRARPGRVLLARPGLQGDRRRPR